MSDSKYEHEEKWNRIIAGSLDAGPVPARVQAKLEETYASLGPIPQDHPAAEAAPASESRRRSAAGSHAKPAPRPSVNAGAGVGVKRRSGHVAKRSMVVAVAAVLVVLLSGVAFAATRLLPMGPGNVGFFGSGQNLSVYNSLQPGVSSLNAAVGDTVEVDGVQVTLDSVSSDRNIVNLFFTLEQEGGFDLTDQAIYEGSQENEWSRLQSVAPGFRFKIDSSGTTVSEGATSLLDAYREDGKVKCMLRIVPEATLPDQVDVTLHDAHIPLLSDEGGQGVDELTFNVGLDLTTVAQPHELGSQDLTFQTSAGEKTLGIERFTHSELGTVLVARNDYEWTGEPGTEGSSYGLPADALNPYLVKVTDNQGNVLTPVGAGDGGGVSGDEPCVIEFAGMAADATSVTLTPMVEKDGIWDTDESRKAFNEANKQHIDVSQIGAKLNTSEYGGYELTGWDVADGTVSISLKPFGWQANGSYMELNPEQDVTMLADTWTNPETEETGTGYHSGVVYTKQDYLSGELLLMTSYYAAGDDELRELTEYTYQAMFGGYREEVDATQTLSF